MKNVTKILLAVVAAVTAMLQVPGIHNLAITAVAAHPNAAALVAGISTVLALLHDPNPQIAQISQTKLSLAGLKARAAERPSAQKEVSR